MKAIKKLLISFQKRFITIQKLLYRKPGLRGCPDAYNYPVWNKQYNSISEKKLLQLYDEISAIKSPLIISIALGVFNTTIEHLDGAIRSVRNQIYPHWQLCVAVDSCSDSEIKLLINKHADEDKRILSVSGKEGGHSSSLLNTAFELVHTQYVTFLEQKDQLHPLALYWNVQEIIKYPDASLIYSDEDKIDRYGKRHDPYFKCDYNYELLLCQNMIHHLGVYSTALIKQIGGFQDGLEGAEYYDLALRMVERLRPEQIRHIPRVLYHVRVEEMNASSKPPLSAASLTVVKNHLKRMEINATVENAPDYSCFNRVRYGIPLPQPLVDIIIPTRDKASLLQTCIQSLLDKTAYINYSITIVDNGSTQQDALDLLGEWERDSRFRIIRDNETPFNYSSLNNRAVLGSDADFVCLMNNDIEIITHEWLHEMIGHALQPGVGAVGARLWYPDGTLQHGGVIAGIGVVAGHAHKGMRMGESGYFGRACLQQCYSAVTGACLLVSRKNYLAVGCLNERYLKVLYSDVDLCLKLNEKGLRNVWTPYAEMVHHESVSRRLDNTVEKKERAQKETKYMLDRWKRSIQRDPAYNPNLTITDDDFSLAWPPRITQF